MKFTFASLLALAGVALSSGVHTSSLNATLTSTTSVAVGSGCSFRTYTATAQSDLDELASCEAVRGDVYITGSLGTASIANVRAIYGDLIISNATQLTSFAADSIGAISGEFRLNSLTILAQLSMGSLNSVGAINWVTLPALIDTGLTSVTDCNTIYVSDTQLSSLEGLNPINVETFNVNNNLNLATIDSDIQTVSNSLSISYNGDDTEVHFDDLRWANNLTFYSVSSVSMRSLTRVNSSVGVFESAVDSFSLPLVTSVGGDLTIENNHDLEDVDFSNLTSVGGGLVIVNNTHLRSVDSFDDVRTVAGAVRLNGDFDNFTMSDLRSVRGAFDLDSTGDMTCSDFNSLNRRGYIQGHYHCHAASASSSHRSHSGSSSESGDSSASSEGASASASGSSSSSGLAVANFEVSPYSILGTFAALLMALF